MIIEIVGLPGSGKSSLYQKLINNDNFILDLFLKRESIKLYIIYAFFLPLFLKVLLIGRKRVYLLNIRNIIRMYFHNVQKNNNIIIDQGPFFDLVELINEKILIKKSFYCFILIYFIKNIKNYSIIHIDVPHELALNRINLRAKDHRIKNKNKLKAFKFLKNFDLTIKFAFSQIHKTSILELDGREDLQINYDKINEYFKYNK